LIAVASAGSTPWFQVDREGDRYWTLKALRDTGGWFTVRSTCAHRFAFSGATRRRRRLRDVARKAALRGTFTQPQNIERARSLLTTLPA
jgi:hypothetical protein